MRKLDEMYDIIFQDEVLKELFLNFHSSKWDKLEVIEKRELIEKINERISYLYGFEHLKMKTGGGNNYGSQNSIAWDITINSESLKRDNGYEILDTYFHELRHSFQHRAVQNLLTDKESANPLDIENWKKNFIPGNYFDGESEYYRYQYVERDAWTTGMLFARQIYFNNQKIINQKDQGWLDYCNLHKADIITFISENEQSLNLIDSMQKEIEEIYAKKVDDTLQLSIGSKYVHSILENKSIEELDFKEVSILLSPYAFSNFTIDQKVELLTRYRDLLNIKPKGYKITKKTVDSIKMGDTTYTDVESYSLVNAILSYNFVVICDEIIKGKDVGCEFTPRAKKELALNLYKDKSGRKINYIKDTDNLFKFSLQPYAKYESEYVLKEFKKLKDIELEAYGKNSANWDFWERFYDTRLIFNTASKIMGMPFSEYYKIQLKVYIDNIAKDKKNNPSTKKTKKSNKR